MAVTLAHVRSCASQDNNACYYVDRKIVGVGRSSVRGRVCNHWTKMNMKDGQLVARY